MVSVIVSTQNEWTFINNNNHFVVFWFVCSAFIRAQLKADVVEAHSDKSANCTSLLVGLHLNSVSHFQYSSERFGNLLILCVSVHRSYFSLTAATSAEARVLFTFSILFVASISMHHTCCICSLFMHCCPFTNICLLVMPYLLFIHGNCVKINTSTPMRCEQTIQSTFISSNERSKWERERKVHKHRWWQSLRKWNYSVNICFVQISLWIGWIGV